MKRYGEPTEGVRRTGRFALELWQADVLVERVRFDFPLLAAETPNAGPLKPLRPEPLFAPGAEVSTKVSVPAVVNTTHAVIVDRTTHEATTLPWPPTAAVKGSENDSPSKGAEANPAQ